jgi:hypothetical protein
MSHFWHRVLPRAAVMTMLLAPNLAYALEIEPGQWESTETSEVNGKPAKPELSTDCVTPEDARDPVKALTSMQSEADGKCKVVDVKQDRNVVSFAMNCGDASLGSIRMTAVFTFENARHYTGRLQTVISVGGQLMTSNMTVDAKWLGVCRK